MRILRRLHPDDGTREALPENPTALEELAALRGIESAYVDVDGKTHETPLETKRALLAAMGIDAENPAALARACAAERARTTERLVPEVSVLRGAGRGTISVRVPADAATEPAGRLLLRVRSESGALIAVAVDRARLADGTAAAARTEWLVELPPLMLGYYDLEAHWVGARSERASGALIVAPPVAYLPPAVLTETRLTGLSVNLYALRSRADFGVGSTRAAADLAVWAAHALGAHCLGLPPLHATPNRGPHDYSPYCPITRSFYNAVYIDPQALPEVADSARAQVLLESPAGAAELAALRALPSVDYERSARFILRVLDAAYADFRERDAALGTPRARAFDAFLRERGGDLESFAVFEALREYYQQASPPAYDWRRFEEKHRSPSSPAVAEFAAARAERVRFHAFVQWCADRQWQQAQAAARDAGMEIGLYHDLAVGSAASGFDAWSRPNLYIVGAEAGAPPDAFQKNGQTWGILPMDPVELRAQAYEPFRAMLRAAMRHGGAVRMDHVMGLFRLWWVPLGRPATEGAYVRYPADELLAVIALESHLHRCMVVGEDLGTVPPGVRERLERERILGCRVALFERDADGRWTPPENYPYLTAASFGTHDLPTLAGFWLGRDVEVRTRLALFRSPREAEDAPVARARERLRFVEAMQREGIDVGALEPAIASAADLAEVERAFHAWLASTGSVLALVGLDDLLLVADQRNLPGTLAEYPNWTGRIDEPFEVWSAARAKRVIERAPRRR